MLTVRARVHLIKSLPGAAVVDDSGFRNARTNKHLSQQPAAKDGSEGICALHVEKRIDGRCERFALQCAQIR